MRTFDEWHNTQAGGNVCLHVQLERDAWDAAMREAAAEIAELRAQLQRTTDAPEDAVSGKINSAHDRAGHFNCIRDARELLRRTAP